MKKGKTILIIFVILVYVLHSIPALALRTSVFFHGFPIVALTTDIQEYEPYSRHDRELLEKENSKLYRLTPPPIEEATQGHLYTWKVSKKVFIYFASYYGEF